MKEAVPHGIDACCNLTPSEMKQQSTELYNGAVSHVELYSKSVSRDLMKVNTVDGHA